MKYNSYEYEEPEPQEPRSLHPDARTYIREALSYLNGDSPIRDDMIRHCLESALKGEK